MKFKQARNSIKTICDIIEKKTETISKTKII